MHSIKIFSTYNKGATVNRVNSFANAFSKFHEVEIVYLKNKYDEEINSNSKNLKYTSVEWDGKTPQNFLLRFLKEIYLSLKLKAQLNKEENVVLLTIPFIPLSILAFFCKSKTHLILDFRDLTWEYLKSTGIQGVAKNIFRFLIKRSLTRSNIITVTNTHEYNWFEKNTNNTPVIISNGISESQFSLLKNIESKTKNIQKPIKVFYIGNVGIAQNLSSVVSIISNFNGYEFNIVGDGNDYLNLKEFITKNNIKNTNLIGRVSPEEVLKYLNEADILFARLDENYISAVPSKLYEYLATNKPIIFSGKGASVELLKRFENIYIYQSQNELLNILNNISKLTKFELLKNRNLIEKEFIREKIIIENLKDILP